MKLLSIAGVSVHDERFRSGIQSFCLPQELECLQDHLEELVSNCRDVVGNLTELESEVCFLFHTTACS